jgi:glycosidase
MLPLLALIAACAGTPTPEPAPARPAWQAPPPPEGDAIYFILVDRFADGAPGRGAADPADPQGWHGGDLEGVLAHLDHIQGLGFKTVWLSPVFQSRQEKFYEWGAFHGYWVEDPRRLEPRFGDEETLRALSDALHERGMRLVLDVVYNHVSFDSPLVEQHPGWFHQEGGIEHWDDPVEVVTHEVHALPDFAQEDPEVYRFLLDTSRHWIELARPDGFRIDAVRHMPADFLASMAADLRAIAGPDFTLLGEMFEGDPVVLAGTFAAGGFSQVFDFPLHYAMVDVFCGGAPVGRLASTLAADRYYEDPGALVTFLDNHDRPRVLSACGGDLDKVRAALRFQLTTRGTPSVTWGTEVPLEGAQEPENRADMDFDRQALAGDLRDLLALRAGSPALRAGRVRLLHVDEQLLVYAREGEGEDALVAVNMGTEPRAAFLPDAWAGRAPTGGVGLGPPSPDGRSLSVAPGGVVAALLGDAPPLPALPESATLTICARAPEAPGELRLVGAGPELGNWDPGAALPLAGADGAPLSCQGGPGLTLDYPGGAVLEAKLVRIGPGGEVQWQPGDNTYALADRDRRLAITWPAE